ncbi:MAG: RagB/SusD family nutrient uptake outer membrane protein [Duncaniella sp.]|uniref:RagB/SusD family nutrient uptake outer membrane protein n=1 Tax=Duncaniella sp. TaxID=2518496 RepID=UPI0023CDD30E|nr:RagB/SusD family nutrient uptake outer membrane protein [Duncaniella sp.]MDE6089819.1 RagB/SusD family nutrient uptake outer membrane protein [Duncaniella sp.]
MKLLHKSLIFGVALAGISVTSCNDSLDVTPDGRLPIEEAFQDPKGTAAAFKTCFNHLPRRGMRGVYFWTNARIPLSDEAFVNAASFAVNDCYEGRTTADNDWRWSIGHVGGFDAMYWERYWGQIRTINEFLKYLPTAALTTESDRAVWEAEAKILRAFFMNELIKLHGPLPVVKEVFALDYDFASLGRGTYRENAEAIIEDCNDAIACESLPWRWTNPNYKMRMNKAMACAIKAEAALFAASPLNNEGEDMWEWAYDVCKDSYNKLINNGYELYATVHDPANYGDNPYQEFFALQQDLSTNPRDRETIFQFTGQGTNMSYFNALPSYGDYAYCAGLCPTQELVDAYDMISTGKSVLNLEQPYLDETHLQPNYNEGSGYDPAKPYEGRDKRFYATVLYNGAQRGGKVANIFTYDPEHRAGSRRRQDGADRIKVGDMKYTATGYYRLKHLPIDSYGSLTGEEGDGGTRYYRLGGVMLDFAEAAIEAGHIDEGLKAINDIRHRAGFDPSVDLKTSDKNQARLLVRHERQVELAYEENRYFDQIRWCLPDEDIQDVKYSTGMNILRWDVGNTTDLDHYSYERILLNQNESEDLRPTRKCYVSKYKRYPIPLNEASLFESITGDKWQNPGW